MTAYDKLMAHQRQTEALAQISGRLGWDQETVMPRGAADQRAEEMAAIEGVLHARRTDPRVGEWLAEAAPNNDVQRAQVRLIARAHARATKVPADLAQALAALTSRAQGIWAGARATEDVAAFLPTLAEVIALKRQEAACLATGARDAYDALLDDYEPGETAASISAMFDAMRPRLVALRGAALGAAHQPADLTGTYGQEAQLALSRELATAFGYDWTCGRLDLAVHPFSSGSGRDVRITTRVVEADPFNCFYATIHEVGHAAYELAIAPEFLLTPLGQGVSMGVHESQSRIYENQIGRSRAFAGWLFGRMQARFGDFGSDANAFYGTLNKLREGFIRTESDEVQYNLHVMLRFDLERALISGDLGVADLQAAWNDRFRADFGLVVPRPSQGMLQDVHWSCGLFGYFPTYSLGNLYAGCLHAALRRDVPDLDTHLAQGVTAPATDWLRTRVQRHGGLYAPRDLITQACGFDPHAGPLLDYLEAKFGAIYGL